MWRNVHGHAGIDELLRVVAFVCPQRDFAIRPIQGLSCISDHGLRRFTFGITIGRGHHGAGDQAVTVVAQGVAHETQLAGGVALAVQPRVGICLGFMRFVAALLAFEIPAITVGVIVVLGHKTLVPGPGLDERAIDAEVLARQQVPLLSDCHHFVEELDDGVMLDEPLAILGEHRGHPNGIVHGQADEPAKQQVVLHLFHQLALRANAVQHLQQHGAQQLLRGNAGPTTLDLGLVHAAKQRSQLRQRLVGHGTNRTQRMRVWNKVLQLAHREQALGEGVGAAHVSQ